MRIYWSGIAYNKHQRQGARGESSDRRYVILRGEVDGKYENPFAAVFVRSLLPQRLDALLEEAQIRIHGKGVAAQQLVPLDTEGLDIPCFKIGM